ncbi:MAG: hypothetical protein KJN64_07845 [Ignavibacteria bacterium]|nr:hypothetical protein [Ignavibacteria bacterium]MBT8381031.1 hypothetical protein [Ignavibacteria bacterium]MBT8393034.1 hypothetical protein [Ignavibacteria bacterium]NNJ52019.1 hypothetical protein [Ignavibacteriaceae bacterium]NNL20497.1 hypothetical protein [Ignavibacteriaceae bacterium]
MIKTTSAIITIIFLVFPFYASSQDTTETEEWKWHWEEVGDWVDWWKKKPSIGLKYGFSTIERKDVEAPFANNNLIELKLGYTSKNTTRFANFIERRKNKFFIISYNSTKLGGGSGKSSDIETNNWRLGFGSSSGYGYKLGKDASVTPFYASSIDWTNIDFKNDSLNTNDMRVADLYDETFRFGSSIDMGIHIQATRLLTLEASYERAIVYERHLFWKWAGSGIIEIAAHGLLDVFIKEILKSSPEAGPVVFFILKSALGYGLYELRQEKMNWPFRSAPPMAFDNIKFGMTFVF